MDGVLVHFDTRADAYEFLSESRRLSATMMWEVTIEPAADGWLMRLPSDLLGSALSDSLERFGGTILGPAHGSDVKRTSGLL